MGRKTYRRYKHILFPEPKPHKEYIEFYRCPNPEELARKRGYTIDKKLKTLLDMLFALFIIAFVPAFERLLTYL